MPTDDPIDSGGSDLMQGRGGCGSPCCAWDKSMLINEPLIIIVLLFIEGFCFSNVFQFNNINLSIESN